MTRMSVAGMVLFAALLVGCKSHMVHMMFVSPKPPFQPPNAEQFRSELFTTIPVVDKAKGIVIRSDARGAWVFVCCDSRMAQIKQAFQWSDRWQLIQVEKIPNEQYEAFMSGDQVVP